MLKLANNSDIERIVSFSKNQAIGVRISCGALAYGLEGKMFSVWMQLDDNDNITALFSSFCGACTIIANELADYEELSLFSSSIGSSLCGDIKVLEKINLKTDNIKTMYVFNGKATNYDNVKPFGDEKKIYDLVSRVIPGSFKADEESYLDFLSDLTYRRNRNFARLRAITQFDEIMACCITAAEDSSRALISAVASSEKARGKGYGKAVVLSMVNSIIEDNKQAYVIALNDSAQSFYEAIGFIPIARIGYI